jgi:hypothetical protein
MPLEKTSFFPVIFPLDFPFTQKMQLTAGIYTAKALVQHLCGRFNDPENVHIFMLGI